MKNFAGTFNEKIRLADSFRKPLNELSGNKTLLVSGGIELVEIENTSLCFVGEIYNLEGNYAEKAKQVLTNFLMNGTESFKSYDGEFTLIFQKPGETLIYRDRHGAGLQVYYNEKYYTSYLKYLLNISDFAAEPNSEALLTFLNVGYIPSPETSLKGVRKIPAGNVLTVKNGNQKLTDLFPWEDFHKACSNPRKISEQEATEEYEFLHKKAIKARINGKSNVGLLLSGGYDSGGNIAGLRDVYAGEINSYSIGFKDNPWTELPLARVLSERFGANYSEYEIDGSEITDLPEIVEFLGDPFQEGGLMVNYTVMKLISSNKPQVILGGDGNDQHFGTGSKELALHYNFSKKGIIHLQKMFSGLNSLKPFNNDNILFRSQFYNDKILHVLKGDSFGFKLHELKKLAKNPGKFDIQKHLHNIPDNLKDFSELYFAHNYFGDIKQIVNEVILFKASKMASMFQNPLSFPYMNTEIYDFLKTLPRELKSKGSVEDLSKGKAVSKFLHKNYLKPKLPTEITSRKKQGGFAPLPLFFKDNNQREKFVKFILSSDVSKEFLSEKYLQNFFKEYDNSANQPGYWFWYKQVKAFQFFNLAVLAVWWEIFINNKSATEVKGYIS